MKTYNFIIGIGSISFQLEVNAHSEDEAIDMIQEEYPYSEGYHYMLI